MEESFEVLNYTVLECSLEMLNYLISKGKNPNELYFYSLIPRITNDPDTYDRIKTPFDKFKNSITLIGD